MTRDGGGFPRLRLLMAGGSLVLNRVEYILYTTRYSTPYLREDLVCELMVVGGKREALIILVA